MTDDTFVIDEGDRFARFRLIAWWDQEKLRRARILVIGAGALGNEVLKNLALLGVGELWIADFDRIEQSNLTRSILFRHRDCGRWKAEVAAEALRDIHPDAKVTALPVNVITDIGLGLFRDVDVVIGCLDNREARLWVNRCCWKTGTPWIDGGIQEINGVAKVFVPPDGACYECGMTEMDYQLINLRYSCPLLRQEDLQAGKVPTAPTIASIIGGIQTQEALKIVHGMDVDPGSAMVYNGVANQFYTTHYQAKPDCMSHETYPEPLESGLSAAEHTADDVFDWVQSTQDTGDALLLHLDRDLVLEMHCEHCDHRTPIFQALPKVGMKQAECSKCGEMARPKMIHEIGEHEPPADRTLQELGVPPYDILNVVTEDDRRQFTVLLDGDRP